MGSPPKPWERAGAAAVASPSPPSLSSASSATAAAMQPPSSATSTSATVSPTRPPALTNAPSTSALSTPYNSASPYSSPYPAYNRFGGSSYSPYGYGGGGMYGGMGMGGMGGYGLNGMGYGMNGGMYGGYGMPGMPMDPGNPSLTQTLEATTQQTFALLHSIVQTFTGLSQMLESTFMATHSSFFAMVGVVDQFANLRNALGSVLGLFGLVRWMKDLLHGRRHETPLQNEFKAFVNGKSVPGPSSQPVQRPSKKPLIIFFLAIFGVPYAMHRLIKVLASRVPPPNALPGAPLDPTQLSFARAKYAFTAASNVELSLKENEIVAVMGKLDPSTGMEVDPRANVETDWWKGRTRDGREGWFPSQWVEVLEKKKPEITAPKQVD